MELLKKSICPLLVLTMLGLCYPDISVCSGSQLFAKDEKKTITQHEPKIMSAPEQDIPLVAPEGGKKKGSRKYLWMGLGAAALIGLIAAVAGGGGSSGGGGQDCEGPDCENPPLSSDSGQGNISASW